MGQQVSAGASRAHLPEMWEWKQQHRYLLVRSQGTCRTEGIMEFRERSPLENLSALCRRENTGVATRELV